MIPVYIRYASPADAPLIARLSRETFHATFAAENTPGNMEQFMREQFNTEALEAEVGAPGNLFLLAYREDHPAGYARMREGGSPELLKERSAIEIARIYAAPDFIGKGVGSALMEACIRIARERKNSVIWLGVWEHNPRAIAFYHKWGFEKFGTHVFWLGEDAQTDWYMKRML